MLVYLTVAILAACLIISSGALYSTSVHQKVIRESVIARNPVVNYSPEGGVACTSYNEAYGLANWMWGTCTSFNATNAPIGEYFVFLYNIYPQNDTNFPYVLSYNITAGFAD